MVSETSEIVPSSFGNNLKNCWFQNGGATTRITNTSTVLLQEFFGVRICGRGLWPPRSPHLTLSNVF
jgi:hypothetical protein